MPYTVYHRFLLAIFVIANMTLQSACGNAETEEPEEQELIGVLAALSAVSVGAKVLGALGGGILGDIDDQDAAAGVNSNAQACETQFSQCQQICQVTPNPRPSCGPICLGQKQDCLFPPNAAQGGL